MKMKLFKTPLALLQKSTFKIYFISCSTKISALNITPYSYSIKTHDSELRGQEKEAVHDE